MTSSHPRAPGPTGRGWLGHRLPRLGLQGRLGLRGGQGPEEALQGQRVSKPKRPWLQWVGRLPIGGGATKKNTHLLGRLLSRHWLGGKNHHLRVNEHGHGPLEPAPVRCWGPSLQQREQSRADRTSGGSNNAMAAMELVD